MWLKVAFKYEYHHIGTIFALQRFYWHGKKFAPENCPESLVNVSTMSSLTTKTMGVYSVHQLTQQYLLYSMHNVPERLKNNTNFVQTNATNLKYRITNFSICVFCHVRKYNYSVPMPHRWTSQFSTKLDNPTCTQQPVPVSFCYKYSKLLLSPLVFSISTHVLDLPKKDWLPAIGVLKLSFLKWPPPEPRLAEPPIS